MFTSGKSISVNRNWWPFLERMIKMGLEQRIRSIRVRQGISQEALAELVDVSRQTISKWETGLVCPSADNLAKLSKAFGVPADAFLRDDWIPPEPEVQVVEVPVEVPVPRPKNYRLLVLLAAVLLAAGILIGALLFRDWHGEAVPESEMESEMVDIPSTGGLNTIPFDSLSKGGDLQ